MSGIVELAPPLAALVLVELLKHAPGELAEAAAEAIPVDARLAEDHSRLSSIPHTVHDSASQCMPTTLLSLLSAEEDAKSSQQNA